MKKVLVFSVLLAVLLVFAGCTDVGFKFGIGEAAKIELQSGTDGTIVEITDSEDIRYITDNICSVRVEDQGQAPNGGAVYTLRWFDESGEQIEILGVMDEYTILSEGKAYRGMEADAEIDVAFLAALLEGLTEPPEDSGTNPEFLSSIFGPETSDGQGLDSAIIASAGMDLQEPPALTVAWGGLEAIEAMRGSYTWTYPQDDDTLVTICVDGMHPLQAREWMPVLNLTPTPFSHMDPAKVYLAFDWAPDELRIRGWDETAWGQPDAECETLDAVILEGDASGRFIFQFDLKEGNCIYEIFAEWINTSPSCGTASYSFCTEDMLPEVGAAVEIVDRIPMVMVDGVLYLTTGYESTAEARCGMMDGEITSTVTGSEVPAENNQSNFGTGYGYQYGPEGTIEIFMNEKWWIYATEEKRQELQFPKD